MRLLANFVLALAIVIAVFGALFLTASGNSGIVSGSIYIGIELQTSPNDSLNWSARRNALRKPRLWTVPATPDRPM